jgi:sugar phosphate isomerase/epimerase
MKTIRIGNQTAFSASDVMAPFEYAVKNGFDAFEWFPDKQNVDEGWDVNDMDSHTRAHIRTVADRHDITLSVHASLQAEMCDIKKLSIMLKNIHFAQEIGATLINTHLCIEKGIEYYVDAITPVVKAAEKSGLKLAIENTVFTIPKDFNMLFNIISKRNIAPAEKLGMCLDLGHANLSGFSRNDFLKFLDMLDPGIPIIHIHMHENYGDSDSHLPIFTGPSGKNVSGIEGFISRMKQRGFKGSIIFEQWPEPPALLNAARDRLYNMWDGKE